MKKNIYKLLNIINLTLTQEGLYDIMLKIIPEKLLPGDNKNCVQF